MKPTKYMNHSHKKRNIKYYLYIFILFFSLLFSPLISYILGILYLIFNIGDKHWKRIFININIAISIAAIIGSRSTLMIDSDDFSNYYNSYILIRGNDYSPFEWYGKGLEIGLPIIFVIISKILNIYNINSLIQVIVMISSLAYTILIEYFVVKNEANKSKATACIWLFTPFFMASQVTRQFFSCICIMFAIYSEQKFKKLFYILLSIIFHLSAIPIYTIVYLVKKYRIKSIIVVLLISIVIKSLFEIILQNNILLDTPGFDKLQYLVGYEVENGASLSMRLLFWFSFPILLFFIFKKKYITIDYDGLFSIFFAFYLIFILYINIDVIGFRLAFFAYAFLTGILIFRIVNRSYWTSLFLTIILIMRLRSLLVIDLEDPMGLWKYYSYYGSHPMYYFLNN